MGFLYVHGRDKWFRPCLVLNSGVLSQIKISHPDLFDIDLLSTATIFILEYVKKYMFLPGQIENWVVIHNINKLAFNKLPRNEM